MISLALSVVLALTAAAPPADAAAARMPVGEALEARIAALDARLFWAFFEGCDPDGVAALLHPDYRMIHDQAGNPAASAAAMVAQARSECAKRAPGGANAGYANRRLLVPGSRRVRAMGEWGALEEGVHGFYEKRAEGWELVGGARYMHLWQWMPGEGRFRLLESLSYDHDAAAPYPPEGSD